MAYLRRTALWLGFLAVGCTGNSEDKTPLPTGNSDGGLDRSVIGNPPDARPDGVDAAVMMARDGASEVAGDASSMFMNDAGGTVTVSVFIDSPKVGGVAPTQVRFTPEVRVLLQATGGASDSVKEVSAVVSPSGMGAKGSASVKLNQTKLTAPPESTTSTFTFSDTPLDLSSLVSGEYNLTVTAVTVSGAMANATLKFLVDTGPIIRVDSPREKQPYRSSAAVDVTITDLPLSAPIQNVSITLGQEPLMFMKGPGADQYTATILFRDYKPPLAGDQILTVRAENKHGTKAVLVRQFVADDVGPSISGTQPVLGELVGKVVLISAVVSDPAGVLDSSVIAVIAHGDSKFEVKLAGTGAGKPFTGLFDTSRIPNPTTVLFPHISFRASDSLGNESSIGYLLSLDNTPPLADLDSPTVRGLKKVDPIVICSRAFDPLGSRAVNDGDSVGQLYYVRARIEDFGNTPVDNSGDFIPIAGIEDSRVQLLMLNDTSQALVVDTSEPPDGICDAVNPLVRPTTTPMSSKDALLVNLTPIAPKGTAYYGPDPTIACGKGTDKAPPEPVCEDVNDLLTKVMSYSLGSFPAVYGIPPVVNDRVQCLGRQFDNLGSNVMSGWVCLAVAVSDKLGNAQVSRPIRVCVGGNCSGAMPDCTGTQVSSSPTPVIDRSRRCRAWRSYEPEEFLRLEY